MNRVTTRNNVIKWCYDRQVDFRNSDLELVPPIGWEWAKSTEDLNILKCVNKNIEYDDIDIFSVLFDIDIYA